MQTILEDPEMPAPTPSLTPSQGQCVLGCGKENFLGFLSDLVKVLTSSHTISVNLSFVS